MQTDGRTVNNILRTKYGCVALTNFEGTKISVYPRDRHSQEMIDFLRSDGMRRGLALRNFLITMARGITDG
jgi:hypothetical protein